MSEYKTLLAFGVHRHDPELGCGDTRLKAARNGPRVICVVQAERMLYQVVKG